MGKQTLTKLHRKFIGSKTEMTKRSDPVDVFPSDEQACAKCGGIMRVAQGQFARFHAKCRAKVRKFKNQGKPKKQ